MEVVRKRTVSTKPPKDQDEVVKKSSPIIEIDIEKPTEKKIVDVEKKLQKHAFLMNHPQPTGHMFTKMLSWNKKSPVNGSCVEPTIEMFMFLCLQYKTKQCHRHIDSPTTFPKTCVCDCMNSFFVQNCPDYHCSIAQRPPPGETVTYRKHYSDKRFFGSIDEHVDFAKSLWSTKCNNQACHSLYCFSLHTDIDPRVVESIRKQYFNLTEKVYVKYRLESSSTNIWDFDVEKFRSMLDTIVVR